MLGRMSTTTKRVRVRTAGLRVAARPKLTLDLAELLPPPLEGLLSTNKDREASRLRVFETAWAACKDPKMRVALAVAFLEGSK